MQKLSIKEVIFYDRFSLRDIILRIIGAWPIYFIVLGMYGELKYKLINPQSVGISGPYFITLYSFVFGITYKVILEIVILLPSLTDDNEIKKQLRAVLIFILYILLYVGIVVGTFLFPFPNITTHSPIVLRWITLLVIIFTIPLSIFFRFMRVLSFQYWKQSIISFVLALLYLRRGPFIYMMMFKEAAILMKSLLSIF
jgi:hypothetical protein